MEINLLGDPLCDPANGIGKLIPAKDFTHYTELVNKICEQGLTPEWRYYNDGKAWLCKILNNKMKNMVWLSVCDSGLKLSFYFTEKTIGGVYDLDINEKIKNSAKETPPSGKLRPVILTVKTKKDITDALEILRYKTTLR